MKRIVLAALVALTISFTVLLAPAGVAQERRSVDVDEVWPFWLALSGLVFAIGALSMWDTRRRRRGGRSRDTRPN